VASNSWHLTFIGPCIANIFAEYNQQDETLLNLFISVRHSTCFRRGFLPSSGAQNCTYSVRYLSDCNDVVKNKLLVTGQRWGKKWTIFTCHSPKIRKITNLFKHTNIGIAFQSTNTIQQHTKPKRSHSTQDHNTSGIYKHTCKTCQMYVGQTSRDLKERYQEHVSFIRNNDPQSTNAQHILRKQHEYGSSNDTMTLFKRIDRASMLIPYEQLFIQAYNQHGHLIAEQYMEEQYPLYQLAIDFLYTSP